MTTDRGRALRYVVGRMWDLSFVCGIGLLLLAVSFGEDARGIMAAFLAFNAGISFCTWFDRFLFDRLRHMGTDLARLADEQARIIAELRRQLQEKK